MRPARPPRNLSPRQARWMLNLYPPFLFHGIRVLGFGPDFRTCTVRVRRTLRTRNLQGTIFGGTIFSAADPIYPVMYWQILAHRGRRAEAWLRQSTIRYLKPAASDLLLEFRLDAAEVDEVLARLEREGRVARLYTVQVLDAAGVECARIENEVYLRLPVS